MKNFIIINTTFFIISSFFYTLNSMEIIHDATNIGHDAIITVMQGKTMGYATREQCEKLINIGISADQKCPFVMLNVKPCNNGMCGNSRKMDEVYFLPISCLWSSKTDSVITFDQAPTDMPLFVNYDHPRVLKCANNNKDTSFEQSLRKATYDFSQYYFSILEIENKPNHLLVLIKQLIESNIIAYDSNEKVYSWGKNGFSAIILELEPLFKQCTQNSLLLLCFLNQLEK